MTWFTAQELLELGRASKTCIACVSVYNLETIQAVLKAAEQENAPIMLSIGNEAIAYAGLEALGSAAIRSARAASVPATVHLNHARSLDLIIRALDLGFGSVMFDGSGLPLAENIRLTRRAVQLAREAGAAVEGELGPLCGPVIGADDADMADLAARFARKTQVDILAFSIPPGGMDDLSILRLLADTLPVPLAIHGAEKLGPDGAAKVHSLGALKVNFHTGVKRAMLQGLRSSVCGEAAPMAALTNAYESVTLFVRGKLNNKTVENPLQETS